MLVYIYDDYGVTGNCVQQLEKCMKAIFKNELFLDVRTITANEIKSGILTTKNPNVFCMGGGFDLGYLTALNTQGCEEIRKYVHNGGVYLGVCAGAYFAANSIEFDVNGPLEVKGERKLKFFNGTCVGPINSTFKYNCDDGVVAIEIDLKLNDLGISQTDGLFYYLNGGCAFISDQAEHTVVATYASHSSPNEAAIVLCNYGKGKCLLSGVHFEFNPDDLDLNNFNIKHNVYPKLSEKGTGKDDGKQYALLKSLVKKILVENN